MKSKILLLFFIVSLVELLAIGFEIEKLQWVVKPLLMVLLGVYYYSVVGKSAMAKMVIGAILFSLVGDVCLLFQSNNELFFIFGLGAFLITHVCYVLTYRQHVKKVAGVGLHGIQKFRFSLPIILAGTGLITILYTHLGALKFPVIVYAIVLMVMVLQALFRFGYTTLKSFWFVFAGALLFMLSDSLIAINKFLAPFAWAGLAIMVTYILAQYLIIQGLMDHSEE